MQLKGPHKKTNETSADRKPDSAVTGNAEPVTFKSSAMSNLVLSGLSVALIAVMAQIAIPLPSGVPLTLSTLAIVLVGIVFGPKQASLIVMLYLLLGAVGIPVFASFSGGLEALLGPAGGFLYSFPLLALSASAGMKAAMVTGQKWALWLGLGLGTIVNYTIGVWHYAYFTGTSLPAAISAAVLPFVIGDILKLIVAGILGQRIKTLLYYQPSAS